MMSLSSSFIFTTYILSLYMFFSMNSLIVFWILMELNLIIFIMIMKSTSEKMLTEHMLFYFMIQSIGTLMFLGCVMSITEDKTMSEWIMLSAIGIKMGMCPFHSWMFKIHTMMEAKSLVIMVVLQKISYLLLLVALNLDNIMLFMTFNSIIGSILIMKSKNIKEMILSSSVYMNFWLWISIEISMSMFVTFMALYLGFNFLILESEEKSKTYLMEKTTNFKWFSAIIFLVGLPPMGMFFLKLYAVKFMMSYTSFVAVLFLWMAVFISTMGYLKMFVKKMSIWMVKSNFFNVKSSIGYQGKLFLLLNWCMFILMVL